MYILTQLVELYLAMSQKRKKLTLFLHFPHLKCELIYPKLFLMF